MDPNFRTGLALLVLTVSLVLLVLAMTGQESQSAVSLMVDTNPNLGGQFSSPDTVHRGVIMSMAPYRGRRMDSASTPEEKAKHVMAHLRAKPDPGAGAEQGWGGTVGQHWTTARNTADTFSYNREPGEHEYSVIFHAQHPSEQHRLTDTERNKISADVAGENEVAFRPNAPVNITGMTFPAHGNGEDKYVPVSARFKAGNTGR